MPKLPAILRHLVLLLPCVLLPTQVVAKPSQVNYETIAFLAGDGHHYTKYTTTRSDAKRYNVFFDKAETLPDYLYINPNRYEFDESAGGANVLRFQQGSYALISQGDYVNSNQPDLSLVRIDQEGTYTLTTWDGKKQKNGHYGFWNEPGNFTTFAAAWVFPENLQVIDYHSNRRGEWVQRGNTLAFFARDVNDLTFEIRYRQQAQVTFFEIREQLQDIESVEVAHNENSVTVILENQILFSSGSASLSDEGERVIFELAQSFAKSEDQHIVVAGHTDNVAITGDLVKTYPTNWELSAKRALNVVHALSSAGVAPTRLEARAFGPFQPRVPNNSEDNRRANRRIEIIIQQK